MLNMSPAVLDAPPPSPACSVIPGTFRITSLSVIAPCCSMTSRGTSAIDCAMSRSGTAYFGDCTVGRPAVTSTDSDCPCTSSSN
jgi:hypothetical protein